MMLHQGSAKENMSLLMKRKEGWEKRRRALSCGKRRRQREG